MLIIDLLITLYCYWIYLYFLFEMTKQKPLKRRYRITRKFGLTHFNGKNKYGLFERTLPISVIMPQ